MRSLPAVTQPMVDPRTGVLTPEWVKHFAGQQSQAGKIASVSVTASPFSYTANEIGHLHIKGGTVSSVTLVRARVSLLTGQISGFFPMSPGDVISIVYTVAPTVSFIPE